MKTTRNPFGSVFSCTLNAFTALTLALAGPSAFAGPILPAQYWDSNNGTAGFGTATGTWAAPCVGTATSGWSTNAAGTTAISGNSVTTTTGDSTNFGTAAAGLGAGTIAVSGTVSSGNITFGSASGTIVLAGGQITMGDSKITVNNASNTIGTVLVGGTNLVKEGSGMLKLTGANINTGTWTIRNGGVVVGVTDVPAASGAFGNASSAILLTDVDSGAADNVSLLIGGGFTLDRAINVQPFATSGTTTIGNTSGTAVFGGTITLAKAVTLASTGGQANFAGKITGTGDINITCTTGKVRLMGSVANDYVGTVTVSSGTLELHKQEPFTSGVITGNVTVNSGATLKEMSTANADQIADNSAMSLGGTFIMNTTANETIGTLTLTGGTGEANAVFSGALTRSFTLGAASVASDVLTMTGGTINIGNSTTGGVGSVRLNGNVSVLSSSTPATITTDTGSKTAGLLNLSDLGAATRTFNVATGTGEALGKELVVSAKVVDGTGLNRAGGILKTGNGTMILSGANTYSGATSVAAGVLRLNSATALPGGIGNGDGTSALTLSGGVIGLGNGDFKRGLGTGATQVQWTGSGGFAAYEADRNVNLGGESATVTWGSPFFVPAASNLILGAADADRTVTFQNGIDFAGATRTIQVDNGAAAVDAILAGTLSNGTFTKTGLGTLHVTGSIITDALLTSGPVTANGANGPNTTFTSPTITIGGAAFTLGASEQIRDSSEVILNSGSFGFGGSGAIETLGTFTNNGGIFTTGANTLIGSGAATEGGGATIAWASGTNTISDGGLVQDSHWVITGGTNTVAGGTTGGVLEVQAPGGEGLVFAGTSSPTLTLDSSNSVAGKMLLANDVTVDSTLTSGTAQILSGGALTNPGQIDLAGGTRTFAVNNGSAATDLLISASLTNGGLTKTGTGTLTLTGTNTYTGGTTVTKGTLLLNGTDTDGGPVSVALGATLGGTGSTTAPVTVAGFLSPGASIESLSTGALTLNNLSTFVYEMNALLPAASAADLLIVNGNLTLDGHIDLTLPLAPSLFAPNTTLTLIQYTGNLLDQGGFFFGTTALTEGTTFNDGLNHWKISYRATSGGLNFATSLGDSQFITLSNLGAIPEPGSLFAIGCMLGSGAFFRSRRRINP
jgi:autotransporter-associated beta strand protein